MQVDYADKNNWCPTNDFCGAIHKGPTMHEIRTGWCSQDNPPESHCKCTGVYATAGRRKVVTCVCECHKPAPKKLKKLPQHK